MMTRDHHIKPFLDDPSLLTKTFREVIEALDSSGEDDVTQEKEAQLREIAKSIERLEKAGVTVPDALRGEKTRLAAELAVKSEGLAAMNRLADEMAEVLQDLEARIGRTGQPGRKSRPGRKRSRSPKTGDDVLREHILRALKKLGGRARVADVLEEVGRQLEGRLLPGDLEWRESSKECVWRNNAKWERNEMKKAGLLRSDSPHGVWELNEDQK